MTTFKEAILDSEFNQNSEDFVIVCRTNKDNQVRAFCHGDTIALIESLESLVHDLKKQAIRNVLKTDDDIKDFLNDLKIFMESEKSFKHWKEIVWIHY